MEDKKQQMLINPPGSETMYEKLHFSQAVRSGNTIWVSGQVGIDETLKPAEGIENQARLAFQSLEKVLKAGGAEMSDIVELVTYHTSMSDMKGFAKVKNEFITANYPAWTAVNVKELVMPGLLVEIRATAVVGSRIG